MSIQSLIGRGKLEGITGHRGQSRDDSKVDESALTNDNRVNRLTFTEPHDVLPDEGDTLRLAVPVSTRRALRCWAQSETWAHSETS